VDGLVTLTNFPNAIATAAPGGETDGSGGTDTVNNVHAAKPVTIEAAQDAATRPVFHHADGADSSPEANGFLINGVESGTVAFRRLTFVSSGTRPFTISAQGTYDQLVVDGCDFTIDGSDGTGVFGASSAVNGARVVVNHSSFTGGESGVFASGDGEGAGPHFDVLNSTFHEFTFSGIQHQAGSSGLISGNSASACGLVGCIRTVLDGQVQVSDNSVTVEADRTIGGQRLRFGIVASTVAGGAHVITANTVTGVGVGPTGYAIERAGIVVGGDATLSRNIVVNADTGLKVVSAVITGTDNVITGVSVGVAGAGPATSVSLNHSDVTSYVTPMTGDGLVDLTCNWWGNAVGPQNVPTDVPATVFTPWATGPVANNAGGTCNGAGSPGATGAARLNASPRAWVGAPPLPQVAPTTSVGGTRKRPPML